MIGDDLYKTFKIICNHSGGCVIFSELQGNDIPSIYRTPEEWAASYIILHRDDYEQNQKLDVVPTGAPVATCKNGKFVGTKDNDVTVWRGIPYDEPIIGGENGNRFTKATDPKNSIEILEAKHYAKVCLQKDSDNEPASLYAKDEDCLYLNVWNN